MDISQQINQLKQRIRLSEIADDGYYLSRQYKEDCRLLAHLQSLLNSKHLLKS